MLNDGTVYVPQPEFEVTTEKLLAAFGEVAA
jgi:hypothetical protein